MKSVKYIIGLALETLRLVLLYFWFGFFSGNWNPGTEQNLFFLFLLGPQLLGPMAWASGIVSPLPKLLISLGTSVKWSILVVETLAALWLLTHLEVLSLNSLGRPEFILTVLIGFLDLILVFLLKSLPLPGTADSGE